MTQEERDDDKPDGDQQQPQEQDQLQKSPEKSDQDLKTVSLSQTDSLHELPIEQHSQSDLQKQSNTDTKHLQKQTEQHLTGREHSQRAAQPLPNSTEAEQLPGRSKPQQFTSLVQRRMVDLWLDFKMRPFIPIKTLNFLIYGGMMALFPFLTLQARSLGITESELGIVYAFLPVAGLLGPPLAGMLADKIGNFKYFLAIMVCLSGITSLLFMPIPNGRVQHTLPEVLPMTLSCSSPVLPSLEYMDKLICDYKQSELPSPVYLVSCLPKFRNSGVSSQVLDVPTAMESSNNGLLYLKANENESKTASALRNDIKETSLSLHLDPFSVNIVLQPHKLPSKMDNSIVFQEQSSNICSELNSRMAAWVMKTEEDALSGLLPTSSSSAASASYGDVYAECRVLAVTADTCTNTVATEDINPVFTFWIYVLVRVLNALTLATSMPLFEGAVVAILKQYDGDFGFQRIYGSLGPLIMTPLSGMMIDYFSTAKNQDYRPAFYLYFVIKFICAAVILTMDLEFKKPSQRVIKDFKSIITTPEIVSFLAMCFCAGACFGAMDTFLFWLLQDMGASKSLMGLTLTVGNLCSLPILLLASPLIEKLGSVNTIILGFSFYVVRFIGYSLIYNPWLCMPFEALECFTVALLITAAVTYASELSTPTTTATVQGLMGGLHHGIGRGAGSLMGGFMMAAIGVRPTFQVMAGLAFVSACVYFVINRIFFRDAAKARKLKRKQLAKESALQLVQKAPPLTEKLPGEIESNDAEGKSMRNNEKDNLAFEHDVVVERKPSDICNMNKKLE